VPLLVLIVVTAIWGITCVQVKDAASSSPSLGRGRAQGSVRTYA
jgi:hypothetical protein